MAQIASRLLFVLSLASMAGGAFAQSDTPWSGGYAGLNLGGASSNACNSWTASGTAFDIRNCPSNTFVGGVQIGDNFQYKKLVWGLEADLDVSRGGNHSQTVQYAGTALRCGQPHGLVQRGQELCIRRLGGRRRRGMGVERALVDQGGISPCESRQRIELHCGLLRHPGGVRAVLQHDAGQQSQWLQREPVPDRHQLLVQLLGAVSSGSCERYAHCRFIALALLALIRRMLFFLAEAIHDPAQAFRFDALLAPQLTSSFIFGTRVV